MATRTRQVFPRDEVAHLWAHKAQDSARDASHNFYFVGPTIYSYGSHFVIAHILSEECGPELAGRVLWNESGYSITTNKMKNIVWRALSRQQKDEHLNMPESIGMGNNVNPHSIERALIAKQLPDVSVLLINRVIECVSAMLKNKHGYGPFYRNFSEAKKAEKLALLFYKRAGKKYPLALLPESSEALPTDKTEFQAWVKGYAKTKMLADYKEALKQAEHYAKQARLNAAECTDGFPYAKHAPGNQWEARNIVGGTYDAAQNAIRYADNARVLYLALYPGKKPASIDKFKKEMSPIAETFRARREEFTKEEARNRVIWDIREAITRNRKIDKTNPHAIANCRRTFADMESLTQRAKDAGLTDSLYVGLASRYSRIGAANTAKITLNEARAKLENAQSYVLGAHHSDVIRMCNDAIYKIDFIGRLDIHTRMRGMFHAEISDIANKARAMVETAQSTILEREADKLRMWLSCESNIRPSYDAGTYARINGDKVETTMGASVPIEHACRLARMYAIAVKRGGQEWKDGLGPMVGHYRVNKIGADGALVIGCHNFNPTEAKRLHAILIACAACQESVIESTV
jgi:hypothetical protein